LYIINSHDLYTHIYILPLLNANGITVFFFSRALFGNKTPLTNALYTHIRVDLRKSRFLRFVFRFGDSQQPYGFSKTTYRHILPVKFNSGRKIRTTVPRRHFKIYLYARCNFHVRNPMTKGARGHFSNGGGL